MEQPISTLEQLDLTYSLPIAVKAAVNITGPAAVYVSSISAEGVPIVSLADANGATEVSQQAVLIVPSDIASGEIGMAFKRTAIRNFNTATTAVGDPIYLSETPGGFTITRPTSGASSVQIVGRVTVVHATAGEFVADLTTGGPGNGGLNTGILRYALVAGGAAGNLTVTGVAVGDRLVAVTSEDDTSGVTVNLTAEFSITATDTINNSGGTSTAAHHVAVWWMDRT